MVAGDLEFFNKVEKEREYKNYVMTHIADVEEAFHRLIEPLKHKYDKTVDDAIDLCGQYIPLHDLSKFSKQEFDAYRKHFYPTDQEKKSQTKEDPEFDLAWELHHKNNLHHPIHWVTGDEKQDMSLNFIFEMLCDWSSVSKHFVTEHGEDTSVVKWYDSKAAEEKQSFSDNTRKLVDFWIDEIFRKPGIRY